MKQKSLIELNGIKYMSPKAAGDLWDMSSQKVTADCQAGRVVGAVKDSGNHFIIPVDSPKPLDRETIRRTLVALLAMKNKPGKYGSNCANESKLFDYLCGLNLLEGRNLYSAELTERGMEFATSGKPVRINWIDAGVTVLNILGSLSSIWGLLSK